MYIYMCIVYPSMQYLIQNINLNLISQIQCDSILLLHKMSRSSLDIKNSLSVKHFISV